MQNNNDVFEQEFYSLEKHFEIVCNKHPHLKLLESQWRFDQELISKALQNVSSVFPHYSRHDASHSRQIIVNIERLLGDRIKFLSATDTWLILEAAYNHDIGMVITQKQIEDMNTPEFSNFVDSLITDKGNYLRKFAKKWKKNKATLPQKADAHGFFHQYIQLLAEWYRRKHSENSAKIVRNPMGEIGLNSSRNELLPNRLFNVLANICQAHGENFKYILKTLPKAEAGMASEDCHPLYVACLLRIADLLDIDDNRFCPVMMSICGNDLPDSSKAHFDKHHSIRHFRLDSEQIEIECICPTPDSYEVAYDWFEWLKKEYNYQTQNWEKIVPFKELGRLPTLMEPSVKIDEPYLILQEGKKPSFQINEEAILKLVRGAGLYSSKFDSIREILQNATDATLHKIWLDHKEKISDFHLGHEELQRIYDEHKIDVSFEPKKGDSSRWILKVKDKGIGISFDDLKQMLEIGSSFKNKSKQNRLNEMPMWFRPSGVFGIGLQSAYLLSHKFTIITRSAIDDQKLKIKFNKKRQSVVIEKITEHIDIGTQFIIEIKIEKNPSRISIPWGNNKLNSALLNYDFMDPDSNLSSLEIIRIQDKINDFFVQSPIASTQYQHSIGSNTYYEKDSHIELHDIVFGDYSFNPNQSLYFRGQRFSDLHISFEGIRFNANFYHTTSDKFLTYNREKILQDAKSKAIKKVKQAIQQYILEQFDLLGENDLPFAALVYINLSTKAYADIEEKYTLALLKLPINIRTDGKEESLTLQEVLARIQTGSAIITLSIPDTSKTVPVYEHTYTYITNNINVRLFRLILFLSTQNRSMFYQIIGDDTVIFDKNDIQPISNELFQKLITDKSDGGGSIYSIGCRTMFPAWGVYRKLSVVLERKSWVDSYRFDSYQNDKLVLPIDFRHKLNDELFYDNSDKFTDWVYEHRKDLNITKDEIKELNLALIEHIKSILGQDQENTDEKEVLNV